LHAAVHSDLILVNPILIKFETVSTASFTSVFGPGASSYDSCCLAIKDARMGPESSPTFPKEMLQKVLSIGDSNMRVVLTLPLKSEVLRVEMR
jgi:hypothetical protein